MRLLELSDRDGRLLTQVERVASRRWHATITAVRPGTRVADEMIPTVDLGVFRSRKAARAAADLVVGHWAWNSEDWPASRRPRIDPNLPGSRRLSGNSQVAKV